MNTNNLIATFALLVAGTTAFAQSTDYIRPDQDFVSTKTRAEVLAELQQAKADGSFVAGGEAYVDPARMLAKRARTQGEAIDTAGRTKTLPANGS